MAFNRGSGVARRIAFFCVLAVALLSGYGVAFAQTPPEPPSGLRVTSVVGNSVTLRWTAPASGVAPTGYTLEGGVTPGGVSASIATGSASSTFTLTAPSGSFYVRLFSTAGMVRSTAPSNEVPVHVNVSVAPSAPANVLALVSGSTVTLAWTNTFLGGAPTSLALDVAGHGAIPLGLLDTIIFNGVPTGAYSLSLRAVNAAGTSAGADAVVVTVPSACSGPPLTPTNFLTFNTGDNRLNVVWDLADSGPAPTTYIVNVTGAIVASVPTTGRSLSGGVAPGTYGLSVVAANACGASAATPVQAITIAVAGFQVRTIYARPQDRAFRPDYAAAIGNALSSLQSWYRGQMGGKTFSLFNAQPETCVMSHAAAYYPGGTYSKVLADVQRCAAVAAGTTTGWVLYADVEDACNDPGRLGVGSRGLTILGSGDMKGLVGERVIGSCGDDHSLPVNRWVGGAGHELGHVFGLNHPPGCDARQPGCDANALMWSGYSLYPNTYLRADDKQTLQSSPFFR